MDPTILSRYGAIALWFNTSPTYGTCLKVNSSKGKKFPNKFKNPKTSIKRPKNVHQPPSNTNKMPPKNGTVKRSRDFFMSTLAAFIKPNTNTNPDKNRTFPSPNSTESNRNMTPSHKNKDPRAIKNTPILVLSETFDDIKFILKRWSSQFLFFASFFMRSQVQGR